MFKRLVEIALFTQFTINYQTIYCHTDFSQIFNWCTIHLVGNIENLTDFLYSENDFQSVENLNAFLLDQLLSTPPKGFRQLVNKNKLKSLVPFFTQRLSISCFVQVIEFSLQREVDEINNLMFSTQLSIYEPHFLVLLSSIHYAKFTYSLFKNYFFRYISAIIIHCDSQTLRFKLISLHLINGLHLNLILNYTIITAKQIRREYKTMFMNLRGFPVNHFFITIPEKNDERKTSCGYLHVFWFSHNVDCVGWVLGRVYNYSLIREQFTPNPYNVAFIITKVPGDGGTVNTLKQSFRKYSWFNYGEVKKYFVLVIYYKNLEFGIGNYIGSTDPYIWGGWGALYFIVSLSLCLISRNENSRLYLKF